MATQRFSFCLDDSEHKHIIQWLERQTNKSAVIASALDAVIRDTVSTGKIYARLVAMDQRIADLQSTGVVVSQHEAEIPAPVETREIKLALDAMGKG
jgi:hypothetical protein